MEPSKMSLLTTLYYKILLHIAHNMTKEDKDKFRFWSDVHSDLPKRILENRQILDWFSELRRKGKISPDNLLYLEDFLQHSGLEALFKDVQNYKTKRELMLRSMKKTTKEKASTKQRGTRMKSHVVEEQAPKSLRDMEPSKMSLKILYYKILLHIADNMTKEDKVKFKFWSHLHSDLPKRILENPEPLDWFIELDRKGKIGPDNLLYLEDFLQHSGLEALLKDVENHKTERQLMLMSMKKTTKDKTSAKQKGTRMKSHVVDEEANKRLGREFISLKRKRPAGKNRDHEKNRDRGMAFVLFEDGINVLLGNSSLRESERKSLSWNIKMMAYQLFGHRVDMNQSSRCRKCSNSQCSSGHGNPNKYSSNSQCSSDDGNPNIYSPNSQCSFHENPSIYSSNSQCSSGHENPSIYSSNSQCSSDDGNPSTYSPNSQCSFHGNPSMDIKSISSSIESLHQRTSYSVVRSALGYTVLGFGAFILSAALKLWLVV